ncbi:MAG: class I SAM-dependent methyltransferase [Candidatus Bathyarchaeota archaeon]|jgi:cyclopropane fatty-acyl-phospholipid synthase-like methyltransferase|nr:class I SAM-dependent methyltransferase [Candidatus Bathyarchaeota archaeon]
MEYFEKLYAETACKWGLKPDSVLVHFLELFPRGFALDLGMGEGRNAIFLAEKGFDVKGVDVSKTAVDRCLQLAKERNVVIDAQVGDLRNFEISEEKYSLIVAAGASLNFLKKSEMEELATKMKRGVQKGGFIFISVVSTDDPFYRKLRAQQACTEKNTFYVSRMGTYVHYFTYNEIKKLFKDMQTILLLKGLELDFHDTPHYHGIIYYLGKKI